MPATKNMSNNGEVEKLTEIVQRQKETIGALQDRIISMSDQVAMINADLRKLREDVSEDLNTLFDRTNDQ